MFMDAGSGSLDERYMSAGSSTDLSVKADRYGDVDALVEVGWSRSHVGAAMLQLMREWDGASRRGLKFDQAFLQMKALPQVRGAMFLWAMKGAPLPPRPEVMQDAEDLSWSILMWMLDPTCKGCAGTGWVSRPNAPKKPCTTCHGTRERAIPNGQRGRALLAFMESCTHRHAARVSAGKIA